MEYIERLENEYRVEYLGPTELKEKLAEKAILYLPIGSIEWHNEHLPLGTDTFHGMVLCSELCARLGGAVLPSYFWNTGCCHRSPVTFWTPEETYSNHLEAVVRGLLDFPAKLIVLVNGHGGDVQKQSVVEVCERLSADKSFGKKVIAADPYLLGTSSSCRIDHADTGETSVAMRLIPNLVRMERDITPDIQTNLMPFLNRGALPTYSGGDELYRAFMEDAVELIEREYAASVN